MSAITSTDLARDWASRLERGEARRRNVSVEKARSSLARRMGVSAGTLENLSRDRIKRLPHDLFVALRRGVFQELAHEIKAHEHELAILVASGSGDSDPEVAEVAAGLARLRSMMPTKGSER